MTNQPLTPLRVFVVLTVVVFPVVAAFLAECCLGEAFGLDLWRDACLPFGVEAESDVDRCERLLVPPCWESVAFSVPYVSCDVAGAVIGDTDIGEAGFILLGEVSDWPVSFSLK